jgi:phospholipase/carboxylesterase
MTELSHIHRFQAGRGSHAALLLLHGTGGDETDLLPLGEMVAPGAALLSPRGRVLENGMPRFFRRLAEGVFDEADVRLRAGELQAFVAEAREAYGLPAPVALGFSNGANIAAALMLLHPGTVSGAVLIRPMVPLREPPAADLAGVPVLVLSGAMDPIMPAGEGERLARQLETAGAHVLHRTVPAGHGLTQMDVAAARDFLASLARPTAD